MDDNFLDESAFETKLFSDEYLRKQFSTISILAKVFAIIILISLFSEIIQFGLILKGFTNASNAVSSDEIVLGRYNYFSIYSFVSPTITLFYKILLAHFSFQFGGDLKSGINTKNIDLLRKAFYKLKVFFILIVLAMFFYLQ